MSTITIHAGPPWGTFTCVQSGHRKYLFAYPGGRTYTYSQIADICRANGWRMNADLAN